MIGKIRKAIVAIPIAALMIVQVVSTSVATTSPAPALADINLSSESLVLATFLEDLRSFDKQGADLGRKVSLTRTEFVAYERQGDDLKRRVSGVQNSLRQIIDKLKAAGQWDNLDQILLAKISEPGFQSFVRSEGLKKTLEDAASGRNINVNEIASPVDALRNKVQGQAPDSVFERGNSSLASRAVRVAYTPAPPMFAASLRCRFARVREAVSGATSGNGKASQGAFDAVDCFCNGNAVGGCDRKFATS